LVTGSPMIVRIEFSDCGCSKARAPAGVRGCEDRCSTP
jgi:hypothetical protein